MRRKTAFVLFVLLLFLFVSCKPVGYPESYSSFSPSRLEKEDPKWIVHTGSVNAWISFSPIAGVDSYKLLISYEGSDERRELDVTSADFNQGIFVKKIALDQGHGVYTAFLSVSDGKEEILLKNSISFEPEEKPDYAPYVYVYRRNEKSVEIGCPSKRKMVYRFDIKNLSGGEETSVVLTPDDYNICKIDNLDKSSSYEITVSHGMNEEELGEKTFTIEVGSYRNTNIELKLSQRDEVFSLEGRNEESKYYLKKLGSPDFSYEITSSSFSLPSGMVKPLERAEYYVEERTASNSVFLSNTVSLFSSIKPSFKAEADTIEIMWEFTEKDIDYSFTVTGPENSRKHITKGDVGEVVRDRGEASVRIEKLTSNTQYSIEIVCSLEDGTTLRKVFSNGDTKTESYDGVYYWEGTVKASMSGIKTKNFCVSVKTAPEESEYPYYITVSDWDRDADSSELYRIIS